MHEPAYAFDWAAFERGLKPILVKALETDEPKPLVTFIKKHWQRLTDPAEGEPLDVDWQDQLNLEDVQEFADRFCGRMPRRRRPFSWPRRL